MFVPTFIVFSLKNLIFDKKILVSKMPLVINERLLPDLVLFVLLTIVLYWAAVLRQSGTVKQVFLIYFFQIKNTGWCIKPARRHDMTWVQLVDAPRRWTFIFNWQVERFVEVEVPVERIRKVPVPYPVEKVVEKVCPSPLKAWPRPWPQKCRGNGGR
jgi:hypothetical protein